MIIFGWEDNLLCPLEDKVECLMIPRYAGTASDETIIYTGGKDDEK